MLIPTYLLAQAQTEDFSPMVPEFNIEVMDAPILVEPSTIDTNLRTIAPTITLTPAVEEKKIVEPRIEDDHAVKGITLSPAITLKPLGYNGQRHQSFFEFNPGIGLSSTFKTVNKRDVSFNIGYGFVWDEFITRRASALRYFEHDLSGSLSTEWTKTFSTQCNGNFNYALWASENREFAISSDNGIFGIFKISDQLSVTTGYHLFYFNDLDTQFHLSDGTLPGDKDDFRQGNAGLGGANSYEPLPGYDPVVGNLWLANNGLQLSPSLKINEGTTIGATYEYNFLVFSNSLDTNWIGHLISLSIAQTLPWKGGSVSLTDQVRLRNYQSAVNPDGSLISNMRNRLTFTLGQKINKTISANFYYRWELNGSNVDNYEALENMHQVNLGFTFGF